MASVAGNGWHGPLTIASCVTAASRYCLPQGAMYCPAQRVLYCSAQRVLHSLPQGVSYCPTQGGIVYCIAPLGVLPLQGLLSLRGAVLVLYCLLQGLL